MCGREVGAFEETYSKRTAPNRTKLEKWGAEFYPIVDMMTADGAISCADADDVVDFGCS